MCKIILTLIVYIAIVQAEQKEEAVVNRIDESTDANTRNARYISHGTSYPNPGSGYPSRDLFYPNSRNPVNNYYPAGTTSFYPVSGQYPNKFDPSYWLSKLPGFGSGGGNQYPGNYPGQYPGNYPNYPTNSNYPGYPGGTNFIGNYPPGGRYPGYSGSGYPTTGYPSASYPTTGYPNTGGYPSTGVYPTTGGYPNTGYQGSGYPSTGNGGYGGYQGNGGLYSYSGYEGYDAAGNRPGNIGFGYQNGRTNGLLPGNRYPSTYPSIVTPSSVSKDA